MSAARTSYQVLWTETARTDLKEIVRFIAHDSVENALEVLSRLEHAAQKLGHMPERGRYVPELRHINVLTYREIVIKPWRIVYRIDPRSVHVLGVLDGRRDLAALLLERLTR
ncbi:MAG: type II toxin-antitoxin system RelE/ParE family toxin [Gammaproteobacteria bacterium]